MPQLDRPGISMIIFNRNGVDYLERFLYSFTKNNSHQPVEAIVVDHVSADIFDEVIGRWSDKIAIQYVKHDLNYSYAASNNYAANKARFPYLLFLDSGIVFTNDVLPLAAAQLQDEDIGAVSVRLDDDPNSLPPGHKPSVQHVGIKFAWDEKDKFYKPYWLRLASLEDAKEVKSALYPAVSGAFLMCRKTDFEQLGGFCKEYGNSFEDVDFCLRLQVKMGKKCLCINEVSLQHVESTTCKNKSDEFQIKRQLYNINCMKRRIKDLSNVRRTKISVICWEVSHNPVGRAFVLADILSKNFDVELIGANFDKYGNGIWEPIKGEKIPITTFQGQNFPMHFWKMKEMIKHIDGDIIYVSKPRLPSYEMGILLKYYKKKPIILDVDDYELSFFHERTSLKLDQVKQLINEEDFWTPYGNIWTRYCDSIISFADSITVSNRELQKKYGGTIIPHARDENIFNPALYDREAMRAELGFMKNDKVIIFVGTPRLHKGIIAIAEALEKLGNPNYKLCIVGNLIDGTVRERLTKYKGHYIKFVPNQPFSQLPKYLVVGDLYCILQEKKSEIAKYQMPAKFTDALAMGIPVLTTNVPPMLTLAEEGLVELLGDTPLEVKIDEIFKDYETFKRKAVDNRRIFLSKYSYSAARKKLKIITKELLGKNAEPPQQLRELIDFHTKILTSRYQKEQSLAPPHNTLNNKKHFSLSQIKKVDDKYDIVFFWKQNDTGIYGRRQDMLVKYLSQSSTINQIIHFDEPIEVSILWGYFKDRKDKFNHSREIFHQTVSRLRGKLNTDKVKFYTYIYKSNSIDKLQIPNYNKYCNYIDKVLSLNKIGQRKTIFWVFPRNFYFPRIIEYFRPEFIVADIIDDHRAFNEEDKYVKKVTQNYKNILEVSDLVFVNCKKVKESMMDINMFIKDKIFLIPNACELPDIKTNNNDIPNDLKKLKGPIIGYVGNLSTTRIDVELLEHVAINRPNWNIVLIGSTHSGRDILRLNNYHNVYFLGVIKYKHVKSYIKNFDVAIIPHRNTKLTQSMNPLKLFVYCAMNKPVVSTKIDNINELRDLVNVANDEDDFIIKIELALRKEKNDTIKDDVMELLRRNSWNDRVNQILKLIKDKF